MGMFYKLFNNSLVVGESPPEKRLAIHKSRSTILFATPLSSNYRS